MQSKFNKQSVARKVRQYLKDCHPSGITLEVIDADVKRADSRWYVPIRTDKEPVKQYEFYEALADVEGELEDKENLTVLLVPA